MKRIFFLIALIFLPDPAAPQVQGEDTIGQTESLVAVPTEPFSEGNLFGRLTAEEQSDIVDRAYPLLEAKWPFNKVFVCWESSAHGFDGERQLVREAISNSWEIQSDLEFIGWGDCKPESRGIRIAVDDSGPHVKYLGKYLDGEPDGMVLNFTYANWSQTCQDKADWCTRMIAVHEFGHAIGFAHEQNRPDTPGECSVAPQGDDGDTTTLTPWDPHSVMNYCNETYANDGQLSAFDIMAVRYIYGDPQ